jgi:hypothetical protein
VETRVPANRVSTLPRPNRGKIALRREHDRVTSAAVGAAFLIPEGRRLAVLAATPGHDSAEVWRRSRRRVRVARIDLALLVFAVAVMVFRAGS